GVLGDSAFRTPVQAPSRPHRPQRCSGCDPADFLGRSFRRRRADAPPGAAGARPDRLDVLVGDAVLVGTRRTCGVQGALQGRPSHLYANDVTTLGLRSDVVPCTEDEELTGSSELSVGAPVVRGSWV